MGQLCIVDQRRYGNILVVPWMVTRHLPSRNEVKGEYRGQVRQQENNNQDPEEWARMTYSGITE